MKCRPLYPAVGRGNQVRVLNDPVTVTEERPLSIPLYESKSCCFAVRIRRRGGTDSMRRGEETRILKSGNLLRMARLNFRVKCNSQPGISAVPVRCLLFGSRHFLWNSPVHMNYTVRGPAGPLIKWQAILLRLSLFPPQIERSYGYSGVGSHSQKRKV